MVDTKKPNDQEIRSAKKSAPNDQEPRDLTRQMTQIQESTTFFYKVSDLPARSRSKLLNTANESDKDTASDSSGATAPSPPVLFDEGPSIEVVTTKPLKNNGVLLRRLKLWSAKATKVTLQSEVILTLQDTPESTYRATKPKLQAIFKKYDLSRLLGKKRDSVSSTDSVNGSAMQGLDTNGKPSSPAIQEMSTVPGVLPTIKEGRLPPPMQEISVCPSSAVSEITSPVSLNDILNDLDRTALLRALFGNVKDDESFDALVKEARALKKYNRRGSSRGSSFSQKSFSTRESSSSRGSSTLGSSTLGSSTVGSSTIGSATLGSATLGSIILESTSRKLSREGSTGRSLSREGSTGKSQQVSDNKHISKKKSGSKKTKRRDEAPAGDDTLDPLALWDAFTDAILDL